MFNLDPLLQLIVRGLKKQYDFTLKVVEKLMSGMIGEDIVENSFVSVTQLSAYMTGPEMIREAFFASENTRGERVRRSNDLVVQIKKSVPRLLAALRSTELTIPILIGLARMATDSTNPTLDMPVKAIAKKRDYAHGVFSQYCTFVAENLPRDELVTLIPTLRVLQEECRIEDQLAWRILRAKLNAQRALGGSAKADNNGMDVDGEEKWWPEELNETIEEVKEDDRLLDRQGKAHIGR